MRRASAQLLLYYKLTDFALLFWNFLYVKITKTLTLRCFYDILFDRNFARGVILLSDLTDKDYEILDFIRDQIEENGYPPTVREICASVGLSSPATVHARLNKLEAAGYIEKSSSKNRCMPVSYTHLILGYIILRNRHFKWQLNDLIKKVLTLLLAYRITKFFSYSLSNHLIIHRKDIHTIFTIQENL